MTTTEHPTSIRILPLHLSTIEHFFVVDDRPAYPMTFLIQLDFTGTIDREKFQEALGAALQRHPLLRSLLGRAKGNRLCWVAAEGVQPYLDWGPWEAPCNCPQEEYLDLRKEIGLRVWVRCGEDRTRILFQFHHASCDGIGCYRFIGDLLAFYGRSTATGGALPELPSVDLRLLRQRQHRLTDLSSAAVRRGLVSLSLREGHKVFGTQVRRLTPPSERPPRGRPTPFPGIESFAFERNEHDGIRAAAGRWGVTVNDLLLAVLFQTMWEWNRGRSRWRRGGKLRVMMPADLRATADMEMPAANVLGYTFISRHTSRCQDALQLLPGIRDETSLIKHERRAVLFNDTVASALAIPGLLKLLLSHGRCLATAVLTNAGDPTRRFRATFPREGGKLVVGNLLLEDVIAVSPLRPGTHVTVAVLSYQRKLSLALRCDPARFTAGAAQEFLALYVDQIRATIAR